MTDADFLDWMVDRLVNVYKESPNVDFVIRLRAIAKSTRQTSTDISDITTRIDKMIETLERRVREKREDQLSATTLLDNLKGR